MTVDNGETQRFEVRSRLVVQETKTQSTIAAGNIGAVFAAIPPLGCLGLICSLVTTRKWKNVLRFIFRGHTLIS